jgi:outer membrane protein OmpA-like peptidoglycan-associated protein
MQYLNSKSNEKDRIQGKGYSEREHKKQCEKYTVEEYIKNKRSEILIVTK